MAVAQRSATSDATAQVGATDVRLLFVGGWLAMAAPALRKERGAGLAIATTLVFAGSFAALLCWYAQYGYNRPNIDASALQAIARGTVAAAVLSVLGNLPLARRTTHRPGPRTQAALGLLVVPLVAAMLSTGFVGHADEAISNERASLHGKPMTAAERAREIELYAPKPMTAAERAEEKKHEIPWDGKGQDPNFLRAIGQKP